MKRAITPAMLAAALFLAGPALALQDPAKEQIDQFIARQATQEKGEEYPDARKTVRGDLNHDGAEDLAVLYTIEGQGGTNNYVQYLAVFLSVKGKLVPLTHASVGGKGYRAVDLVSIKNNIIILHRVEEFTTEGKPPRVKGTVRYALVNRKLKQVK